MSPDLILLGISLMIWGVGEGMFFIFQPLYLQQLGADPVAIGAILGAGATAMALVHIPAGHLADRLGRKPLLLVAWVMGMLAAWAMALAPSLPYFVAGIIFYNLTSFVSSPMNSYITAARGKLSVGRALTLVSALYNTGAILGPVLGGQIGKHYGLQKIYFVAACLFILSTAVLIFIKKQPIEAHDPEQHRNIKIINRQFIIYEAVIFLAGFSMYLSQPLSANFLQNQHHLSLDTIGILGSITSIGVVLLNLGLGGLKARIGFLLGQVSVAIFAIILWRGTGMVWFGLAYFLVGGYRISRAFAAAQTRDLVHPSRMGWAYGITETIGASAIILASTTAGFLYDINPSLMYIVAFSLILVSLLISVRFIPRPDLIA